MTDDQSRLTKAGAERLLAAIDTDVLFDALVGSMRAVLRLDALSTDDAVLASAAQVAGWSAEHVSALRSGNEDALTSMAIELCEFRVLGSLRRCVGDQH